MKAAGREVGGHSPTADSATVAFRVSLKRESQKSNARLPAPTRLGPLPLCLRLFTLLSGVLGPHWGYEDHNKWCKEKPASLQGDDLSQPPQLRQNLNFKSCSCLHREQIIVFNNSAASVALRWTCREPRGPFLGHFSYRTRGQLWRRNCARTFQQHGQDGVKNSGCSQQPRGGSLSRVPC